MILNYDHSCRIVLYTGKDAAKQEDQDQLCNHESCSARESTIDFHVQAVRVVVHNR